MPRTGWTDIALFICTTLYYVDLAVSFKIELGCGEGKTRCGTGECIYVRQLCDGNVDCVGGWDEDKDDCRDLKTLYITLGVLVSIFFIGFLVAAVKVCRILPWDEIRSVMERVLEDYDIEPPSCLYPDRNRKCSDKPEVMGTHALQNNAALDPCRQTEQQTLLSPSTPLNDGIDETSSGRTLSQLANDGREYHKVDSWHHHPPISPSTQCTHGTTHAECSFSQIDTPVATTSLIADVYSNELACTDHVTTYNDISGEEGEVDIDISNPPLQTSSSEQLPPPPAYVDATIAD